VSRPHLIVLLALAARLGAAILNAAAPLFTALFALGVDRAQRVTGVRLVGDLPRFLGETVTAVALVGLAFVLGGVALGTGTVRR